MHYVLEGSIRRSGDKVRISAQLIEAATGNHVWAERYDRDLNDAFAVQDELTENVAGAVGAEINRAELERVGRQRPTDLGAHELAMKAVGYNSVWDAQAHFKAEELALEAISRQENLALGYSVLATSYLMDLTYGFSGRPIQDIISDTLGAAQAAIKLDPNDESSHLTLGAVLWLTGDHEGAIRECEFSLELNPNFHAGHIWLGVILGWSGTDHYSHAIEHFQKGMRLAPRDPFKSLALGNWSVVEIFNGNYEEAIHVAREALHLNPTLMVAHRTLAAALALVGNDSAAEVARARLEDLEPEFIWSRYLSVIKVRTRHEADYLRLLEGLRLAGFPH